MNERDFILHRELVRKMKFYKRPKICFIPNYLDLNKTPLGIKSDNLNFKIPTFNCSILTSFEDLAAVSTFWIAIKFLVKITWNHMVDSLGRTPEPWNLLFMV